MDRKGSMFDKPGSSDRSCSQTSNLQKKWTFDYWSDFAAPPIPWDLKCTDPNSIFAPPKNPISILNPFTKKPRRRRKGGALEDDEEWVMIDFVDLGKVKDKMDENKDSPEPLQRSRSASLISRKNRTKRSKSAEESGPVNPPKKATTYFCLSKELRMKREALCDDRTNAQFCDTTFHVGPDQRVYYGVSILFRIHTPSINELWTQSDDPGLIVMEDIMPPCFEFLRAYFYCLNPPLCGINAADVLYAAKKFGLPALENAAYDFCLNVSGLHDSLAVLPRVHELGYYDLSQQILDNNELFEEARNMFQFKNLANIDHRLLDGVLTTAAMQKTGRGAAQGMKDRVGRQRQFV